MKFFLTGGTGFVGINLAYHLAGLGIYLREPTSFTAGGKDVWKLSW